MSQDYSVLQRLAEVSALCAAAAVVALSNTAAQESSFDVRARETEQRMTELGPACARGWFRPPPPAAPLPATAGLPRRPLQPPFFLSVVRA